MPTTTTDGTPIPVAGTTTQYVADPAAGWMYVVTTTVSVQQLSQTDIQGRLNEAQEAVQDAQALVDELSPQVTTFTAAVAAVAVATPAPTIATPAPADTDTPAS